VGSSSLVEVTDLIKSYDEDAAGAPVLRGVTFALGRGESTSLVGSSGAGKSTLLAILAGLMVPDSGSVCFDGRLVTAMNETERAALRADGIGVVLQSDNLIPFLTAVENVELAIKLAAGHSRGARARELLGELGLGHRADDYPRRLSGGEAQRAALAVALANDPELLLADEVTGQLDTASAVRVVDSLLTASAERGLTALLVTHSPLLAERTDHQLLILDGAVIEQ
jgi:putative ABC transport system ATP-binding protein